MRNFSSKCLYFTCVLLVVCIVGFSHFFRKDEDEILQNMKQNTDTNNESDVTIVAAACGESRIEEVMMMVKSALMFSKQPIRIVLITEAAMFERLRPQLEYFQKFHNFTFLLKEAKFPEGSEKNWKNLFAPCASERLFLSTLLSSEVNGLVLYVDSDTLFLSPPHDTFQLLYRFNMWQIAGFAPESESNDSHYPKYARHPFYGKHGLNSGIALMNLTKMREVDWEKKVVAIFEQYQSSLLYPDQDIINIYFYYHPDEIHALQCEYNYRSDQCDQGMKSCPTAFDGIKIIHGNRRIFHNSDSIFGIIYSVFQKVNINH